MKKIFIFLLFTIALSFCYAMATEPMVVDWKADNILNGRSIVSSIESEGPAGRERATLYIKGVADGLYSTMPDRMRSLYAPINWWQIPDKVIEYYQNNPEQRQRNVVEVILSGCK